MTQTNDKKYFYKEVTYWVKHYAKSGVSDKRALEDFVVCETNEKISSLRGQLYSISQGKYNEKLLDQQVGPSRKARHGSYHHWAKLMLLWLSEIKF